MAEPKKKKEAKTEAKAEVKTEKPTCPKCGQGNKLAEHVNRFHCGKCGYTRMK